MNDTPHTRDEIIALAKEKGAKRYDSRHIVMTESQLISFASSLLERQKEEDAKICQTLTVNGVKADITGYCESIIRS